MLKPNQNHCFQGMKHPISWFMQPVKCSNICLQKLSNSMFVIQEMCLWIVVFVSEQDQSLICFKKEVSFIKMSVIVSKFCLSLSQFSLWFAAYLQSKMCKDDIPGISVRKTKQDTLSLTCIRETGPGNLIHWKSSESSFTIKQCMGLITGKAEVSKSSLYQFIAPASGHSSSSLGSCWSQTQILIGQFVS